MKNNFLHRLIICCAGQQIDVLVAQSCPTLCDPMDCSPQGSSVHGILQARILEWVAISFSRGSSRPRDRTQVSRIAGRRFILWVTREARKVLNLHCEISKNTEKFPISSHSILSFNHQILLNDFHVLITVFFWWRTNMQISKSLTWMFIN